MTLEDEVLMLKLHLASGAHQCIVSYKGNDKVLTITNDTHT